MSEWKACLLKDLCDFISTKTSITNATLQNYVSTENMLPNFGGVVNADKLPSGNTINSFQRGDVLFSNIRTYFKKVWFAEFNGTVSADVLVVRAKSVCDPRFLYYLLCEPDFTEYTVLTSRGAKMPRGDKEAILSYKLDLPPLPEQKAIASVLSSLDDKIDLLHRQNKTLETMAEILFRQWFIEEAKEDWEEFELNEFGQIICGKTPSKSNANYFGDDVPFLKIPDMHGKVFITKTTDSLSQLGALSQSKKMVPQNSICVSCIATVGLVCITDCDLQTNQQINSIVPTEPKFLYYLYEVMLGMYDELHNLASGGTATLNLNTGDFSRIKIAKPDDETLLQFNNAIIPLFTKIRCNVRQIQTLENLRDTLLPKLMSGEVRVQYQTEEVA